MESQNDVLNVELDKLTNTLHVTVNRSEGGGPGGGDIVVVNDETWLPLDAQEGDVGVVVKDGTIVFYTFHNGEWEKLTAPGKVSVDNQTINVNPSGEIQTVGMRETNQNQVQKIWRGTRQEYDAQNKEASDDLCYIIDDEQAQYIDNNLDKTSLNAISNHAVTQAMDGSLESLIIAVGGKMGVTIKKQWNARLGCWTFSIVG